MLFTARCHTSTISIATSLHIKFHVFLCQVSYMYANFSICQPPNAMPVYYSYCRIFNNLIIYKNNINAIPTPPIYIYILLGTKKAIFLHLSQQMSKCILAPILNGLIAKMPAKCLINCRGLATYKLQFSSSFANM